MLKLVPLDMLNERLATDAERYRNAKPFPHLVIDEFLSKESHKTFIEAFPSLSWSGWHRGRGDEDPFQPKKKGCGNCTVIPEPLDRLIYELNSGPFLLWLEKLTGISLLLPDPQLEGGGLHASGPGGKLLPHTDFHYGHFQGLHRRLNLLVYLNEDWRPENNGALELWDQKEDCVMQEILPVVGRAVLFQTDADSMHGFSKPIVGRVRNSVALYYYTVQCPLGYSGDHATHWRVKSTTRQNSLISRLASPLVRRGALLSAKCSGRVADRLTRLSHRLESLAGRNPL